MRLFVFSLFIAAAIAQSVNPAASPVESSKKVRLEGSVVSLTGEPIPRAAVRLTGGTPATAAADDAGKFVIENILPGSNYRLLVERQGYINSQYGARSANRPGAPLALVEGQVLKGLTIIMTPQGTISGKITDRDNDPIQGAVVFALTIGYQRGVRTQRLGASGKTDDKGDYRIASLAPGRFYLVVLDRPVQSMDNLIGGLSDKSSTAEVNGATYYPNVADAQSAVPVNLAPGDDLRGIDIRMRASRIFVIRGKAVNASTGAPIAGLLIRGSPRQRDAGQPLDIVSQLAIVTTQTAPDGTFELRNITAREWTLTAIGSIPVNGGAPSNSFGDTAVSVRDADVGGVVLPLAPGVSISGRVRFESGDTKAILASSAPDALSLALAGVGAGAAVLAGRPIVALTDLGLGGGLQSVQVNEDGTFKMRQSLDPGKFALSVSRVAAAYYIKSVRLGAADVTHSPLDFTSGAGGTIDILFADNPAELSGRIHAEKNESMAGVMVALWTKDPDLGSLTGGVQIAYGDQNGSFQFKGLGPGEYYVAAWEDADSEQLQNRDLLAMFADDDAKIKLGEGAKQSAEAKLITSEKLAAAVGKLP